MPELPEVESFKKYIVDTSLNQKIKEVKLASTSTDMLLNTSSQQLKKTLEDNVFTETYRHGNFCSSNFKKTDTSCCILE